MGTRGTSAMIEWQSELDGPNGPILYLYELMNYNLTIITFINWILFASIFCSIFPSELTVELTMQPRYKLSKKMRIFAGPSLLLLGLGLVQVCFSAVPLSLS